MRKRERGKILKILLAPGIAKICFFVSSRDVVEDHGCQKQALFDWELENFFFIKLFCSNFHSDANNMRRRD